MRSTRFLTDRGTVRSLIGGANPQGFELLQLHRCSSHLGTFHLTNHLYIMSGRRERERACMRENARNSSCRIGFAATDSQVRFRASPVNIKDSRSDEKNSAIRRRMRERGLTKSYDRFCVFEIFLNSGGKAMRLLELVQCFSG